METPRTLFAYKQLNANSRNRASSANKYSMNWKKSIWRIIGFIIVAFVILGIIVSAFWLRLKVFKNLPDVSEVKNMSFSQATVITDRNGVELYKLFDENREYVDYTEISENMVNAIVAIEDQRYREHEWLDPWGIFRAAIKWKWWASTLPQQLMTNVFKLKAGIWAWASGWKFDKIKILSDKVAYKLRQIILSKRLNTTLQKQIKAENSKLSTEETKKEMKKEILELYLNYIEFGNNSFWVEAASKWFFGVPAAKLDVLQAAILASLPKWPTQYSPLTVKGKKNLMWYFVITDTAWNSQTYDEASEIVQHDIITKFSDAIKQADFSNKNKDNESVSLLKWLGSFTLIIDGREYYVTFYNWRKDVVLSRMFEDGYITEDEFKEAEIEALTFEFKSSAFSIKAPHFVFWIRELLEEQYGEDAVMQWWLVVKTTLDYNIQQMAEQGFQNNGRTLYENGANNSSMIYVNTDNGDVLAYVGSLDYFNNEIQWQIDMVRSPRQSGSSIKPLIYALGFMKLPITIDTPIYDIEYQVWPDKPNNSDNSFEGMIPLKAALGHSRNIPAIKMFVAVGGEAVVKPFLKSLWLPLDDNMTYGYPLSIWAAEVSLLEFAGAYSYLTTETPAEINPILEITSADGSVLYKKEVVEKEDLIPAWVKYLLWKILSDPNNRLAGWVNKFNVSGLTYALKTGTSNMKTAKWNRPRDWLVAAYTPDNLILMWAGNADASPMNSNAYWGTIQAQPLKDFLGWLVNGGYLTNREMTNVETASLNISKITWKLPAENAPSELIVSTMWYAWHIPTAADSNVTEFEYDASCMGVASPLTPFGETKHGYYMNLTSFMPGNEDLESIKEWWNEKSKIPEWEEWSMSINILTTIPEWYCEARQPEVSDAISVKIIDPETDQKISAKPSIMYSVKSDALLKSLNITVDGTLVFSKSYVGNKTEDLATSDIDLSNFSNGAHTITVQAVDAKWQINMDSIIDVLQLEDIQAPYLVKEQSKKQANSDWSYQITLIFDDELSGIPGWNVTVDGKTTTFEWRLANFTTKSESFEIEVKDNYGNTLTQTINLSDLQ